MKAGNFLLLRDFMGANKVIFQIPVYQRNYDWSEENCKRLLGDIKKIMALRASLWARNADFPCN